MNTRRHFMAALSVTVSALAALAVGGQPVYAKDLKIGFSQVTLQSPFYVQLKNGAEAAAKPPATN